VQIGAVSKFCEQILALSKFDFREQIFFALSEICEQFFLLSKFVLFITAERDTIS
jgi:hypothetical protein